ncbi:MAG: hypothetical protein ACKOCN_11380 [Planctomycetaceae bacterium]
MTIVRVGTNSRYANGWEQVFGGSKVSKGRKKAAGSTAGKSTKKVAKKAAKKKSSKRR